MMILQVIGNDLIKMGSYLFQILTRKDQEYFDYMCLSHNNKEWELDLLKVLKIIENVYPNLIAISIIWIFYIFGSKPIEMIHSGDDKTNEILIISTYSDERYTS